MTKGGVNVFHHRMLSLRRRELPAGEDDEGVRWRGGSPEGTEGARLGTGGHLGAGTVTWTWLKTLLNRILYTDKIILTACVNIN